MVLLTWDGQSGQRAVWGNNYVWAGYQHTPLLPGDPFDQLGILAGFIACNDFAYIAGQSQYQYQYQYQHDGAGWVYVSFGSGPGPDGPLNSLPEYLLDLAAPMQPASASVALRPVR